MRASAMLSQQAADNVADAAAAVKMLGDQVDTTRQMNIIFDKMNLLGQEVGTNQYIVKKAKEYQRLKEAGNIEDVLRWMEQQGPAFDKYIREIKATGGKLNDTLKAIAKELDIPIIALSQLSRQVEQRDSHKPQLSDLRDSGSIEQDADVVMFVYREGYYLEKKEPRPATVEHAEWQAKMNEVSNLAEIIIGKHRPGPTGNVMLEFEAMFTKFKDRQNI